MRTCSLWRVGREGSSRQRQESKAGRCPRHAPSSRRPAGSAALHKSTRRTVGVSESDSGLCCPGSVQQQIIPQHSPFSPQQHFVAGARCGFAAHPPSHGRAHISVRPKLAINSGMRVKRIVPVEWNMPFVLIRRLRSPVLSGLLHPTRIIWSRFVLSIGASPSARIVRGMKEGLSPDLRQSHFLRWIRACRCASPC